MPILLLLGLPLLAAAVALVARRYGRWLALLSAGAAGIDLALSFGLAQRSAAGSPVAFGPGDALRADALSAYLAVIVSGVAFVALCHGVTSLERVRHGVGMDDRHLRRYYALANLFVFTMLLSVTANNVGVMWVAIEATTIATAFLISLERTRAAIEASWKYILIGSIGIAMAFIGTVLAYFNSVERIGDMPFALNWTVLSQVAPRLNADVVRLAFAFIVVGYGTKAGLAPMHTWLPDAHSEAPAPVSAMMSGALLVVAFYAILRWKAVTDACLGPAYGDATLLALGTFSAGVAALMLVRQASYKRMLAYSSVEHIGLVCVGSGLGPAGTVAALLHMAGHAAAKSLAFLAAGDVAQRYGSTRIAVVRGVAASMPWTGALFLLGVVALLGLPPFGPFVSEVLLFRAGLAAGHPYLIGVVLILLVSIFVSFLTHLHRLLYGEAPGDVRPGGERLAGLWPLGLCVAALAALGVVVPGPLLRLVQQAAGVLRP